jgi:hypothetical protein
MADNPENRSRWTMASEVFSTPFAVSARQIDFPNNAPADEIRIARTHNLSHKLVARRSAESVVPTLQFEICVANAAHQQPYQREPFRGSRPAHIPHLHTSIFNMDCEH